MTAKLNRLTMPDNYLPTRVGYFCAATVRYRPEACDSKRIEIYPTAQYGDLGIGYEGPENAELVFARAGLRRIAASGG